MNAPIAWIDGLICIIIFAVLFTLLAWIFRNDSKQTTDSI